MWPKNFADRLEAWAELRTRTQELLLEAALQIINNWWHQSPWQPYYLHWDDQPKWPDPWQLLSDNVYCDLARGLGILYTVSIMDREDLVSCELVLTKDGRNLVLINKEIYTLNWNESVLVNTPVGEIQRRFINTPI